MANCTTPDQARLPMPSRTHGFLLWCLVGGALVHYFLVMSPANANIPAGFSPIFWYLYTVFDPKANLLLGLIVVCAFALRDNPFVLNLVRYCGQAPWIVAGGMFVLLCLGSIYAYHNHPLSEDEYAAVFQAKVFAAGKLSGSVPSDLVDRVIPVGFQNYFFAVSRTTGAISSTYWPGFSIILTPFVWLGIPWAANPLIGALSIPAVHRLAHDIAGQNEAPGWAVALTIASPVFVASSISYYAMQAHFLANVIYALLLLRPTVWRAVAAGLIGSFALALHQPPPHLAFALPFLFWLCFRGNSLRILAALLASYIPLSLLLGFGWKFHLINLVSTPVSSGGGQPGPGMIDLLVSHLRVAFSFSALNMTEVRIAWLTKLWTWGAPGLVVLAAFGFWAARHRAVTRVICASLVLTFLLYCFVPADQGHGWGSRYLHSAWFALPVLASIALTGRICKDAQANFLRNMAAWGCVLSFILANGLRITQIDGFIERQIAQVPPLAEPAQRGNRELIFIDTGKSFYRADLVQNDPFLRESRIVLVQQSPDLDQIFVERNFPGFVRATADSWGERWVPQQSPSSP